MFTIEVHTFQITSNNPILLKYPSLLCSRKIFVQVVYTVRRTYCNNICAILTRVYHIFVLVSLSLFASLIHDFVCFARFPGITLARPVWSPITTTTISSPHGGPSDIFSVYNRIGICSTSGGFCM